MESSASGAVKACGRSNGRNRKYPQQISWLIALCAILLVPSAAIANGHGPLFGLATPTHGESGWTLDTTFLGRGGGGENMDAFGTMLTYGITPDLQLSVFAPALLTTTPLTPSQMTSMMPGNGAYEGLLAWRFQRDDFAAGSRYETTGYAGVLLPGPQKLAGVQGNLAWAPGFYTALASGLASRSNYLWYGAGFTHYALAGGDRRSDLLTCSLVYGYRPAWLRWDYPQLGRALFSGDDRRAFRQSHAGRRAAFRHRRRRCLPRAKHALALQEHRHRGRHPVPALPQQRFEIRPGGLQMGDRLQLFLLNFRQREVNRMEFKSLTIVSGLIALALFAVSAPASAEFRHVDIRTFGMD
jgi:hypothetical protein